MQSSADTMQLVQRVADGDRQAFAELFTAYAPRLRGFLMQRLRGNATAADELTQEVFLRVWRRASSFDAGRGSFDTWLFTVARNAVIDHARRKRPEIADEDPTLVSDPSSGADQQADRHQRAMRLREALETLPEAQRSILHKAYFEGASLREIAEAQDVPLGTVKSRVRLAMAKLRQSLGGVV